jgi:hypothetical protein
MRDLWCGFFSPAANAVYNANEVPKHTALQKVQRKWATPHLPLCAQAIGASFVTREDRCFVLWSGTENPDSK